MVEDITDKHTGVFFPELLGCPVCGVPARVRQSHHTNYSHFCVECSDGKCGFKTPWVISHQEAVRRWHRRKIKCAETSVEPQQTSSAPMKHFMDFMRVLTETDNETKNPA